MMLVYLTAKKYPSRKTDPFYVQSMATAFARLLKDKFVFVVRGPVPPELADTNAIGMRAPKRLRTLYYLFALPALILRRGWSNPNTVILSYDPNLLTILVLWRRLGLRYRVASDWHQLFDDWRDHLVARGSDYGVTTSERLCDLLVARDAGARDRVRVAYGGVDPAAFAAVAQEGSMALRARLGLPADAYLVGYVGTFTSLGHPKGIDTLLEAVALVPHVVAVLVGGTHAELPLYRELAAHLGVSDRCILVPKQPFDQVVAYERAMDVLVIPYPDQPHFRDYGFPMKVWEYLAAGRPIVYSNLAIIAEALEGRGTPFIPGNAESLAQTFRRMFKNRATEEAQATHNPKTLARATWDARASAIINFIS